MQYQMDKDRERIETLEGINRELKKNEAKIKDECRQLQQKCRETEERCKRM